MKRIRRELVNLLQDAWAALSPRKQAQLKPLLGGAHQQMLSHMRHRTGGPPPPPMQFPSELHLAHSVLFGDPDGLLARVEAGIHPHVDPKNGTIWGTGKYQLLDADWLEAAIAWLTHPTPIAFPSSRPTPITIPDDVTIAVIGDWGTGNWGSHTNLAGSTRIANYLEGTLKPDILIHLGDVYYFGGPWLLDPSYETANLVNLWPLSQGFTLNSNHEMYDGAHGYFQQALTNKIFAQQQGLSYFALENKSWVIVGLDSAYFDDWHHMYMAGTLDSTYQLPFLTEQVASCRDNGKQLIVLTHHNALALDGTGPSTLWSQVEGIVNSSVTTYWYWGHQHAGVVYPQQKGIWPRCVGHSAIPWGNASDLAKATNTVSWYEQTPANDPDDPLRVVNGFAYLRLNGATITEQFIDENGNVTWPSPASPG